MNCLDCKGKLSFIKRDEYTIGFSIYYCSYCEEEKTLEDPLCQECGDPKEYCSC